MRIALLLVLALVAVGCAKKQPAPAAPKAMQESQPDGDTPPGGGAPDADAEADDASSGELKGDPCDGGE